MLKYKFLLHVLASDKVLWCWFTLFCLGLIVPAASIPLLKYEVIDAADIDLDKAGLTEIITLGIATVGMWVGTILKYDYSY